MKKLLTLFLFGLLMSVASTGFAQNGNGQQHSAAPTQTVVKVLKAAKKDFAAKHGIHMSLGQWMQKYHNCECTIIEVQPKGFRVEFGGGIAIVVLETL